MKFQPVIKWSGSKRALSEEIVKHFPKEIKTYYEPFCGSCSVLFQLLNSDIKVDKYVCSDINSDLINFFNELKVDAYKIYEEYKIRWDEIVSFENISDKVSVYNNIRKSYNETKNIYDFIFLSRTAINGLIRYNSKGEFNSPFHLTRNGINPERFKKVLMDWSLKLNENNVTFLNCDYRNIVPVEGDYVFLDSPYANTKGMYFGDIDLNLYWEYLKDLKCEYSFTFDGKRGLDDKTYAVPIAVYNKHIYLESKLSSFNKLQNSDKNVKESMYIK